MARNPPQGFSTWHDYNVARVNRLMDLGYSRSQAYGHPAKGEESIKQLESEAQTPYDYHIDLHIDTKDFDNDFRFNELPTGHSFSRWEGSHDLADAMRQFDELGLSDNFAEVYYDDDRDEWDIWFYENSE